MTENGSRNIIDVQDLQVSFFTDSGVVKALNGVNFAIPQGKAVGVVGESGCGKTVTSYAVLQLLAKTARITQGRIAFEKRDGTVVDLTQYKPDSSEMRRIRGGEISMIFQEPMSSLSPVHTVYNQIAENLFLHKGMDEKQARERTVELLGLVGIPKAAERMDEYTFQFSGGMRQRVMIAMALAPEPRVLIADEPTTALDVTIQAQVLKLIKRMQEEFNLSLMLITHDLGVVAHMVDQVYVMYRGRVVEDAPVMEVFYEPLHPYTRGLLNSIPKLRGPRGKVSSIPGTVPDSYNLPTGCLFHPRCSEFIGEICRRDVPETREVSANHRVSCFLYDQEPARQEEV